MSYHTHEKPHKCLYFDYNTAYKGNLKHHVTVHQKGEKPHHCPHCEYEGVNLSLL